MTVNYKLDAMLELRKYLWSRFTALDIFDADEYYSDNIAETIIPIIPVQQLAEMNQAKSALNSVMKYVDKQ